MYAYQQRKDKEKKLAVTLTPFAFEQNISQTKWNEKNCHLFDLKQAFEYVAHIFCIFISNTRSEKKTHTAFFP